MKDELLTITEVAKYLKIARSTVYELIKRKTNPLPVIRTVGEQSPRISSDFLRAWVAGTFEDPNLEVEDQGGGEK